jgi:hypothetical protein
MSPERKSRLRLIGATAVVTFLLTIAVVYATAWADHRSGPPAPTLAAPKTITITLYPLPGWDSEGSAPVAIPASEFDRVMRLITPGPHYCSGGVHDWTLPLSAVVVITHEGLPDTSLLVRWSGKNPALISADGSHYFYGEPREGIHDGAMQLRAFVREVGKAKPGEPPAPR